MKKPKPQTYMAVPEAVDRPCGTVACELGLPTRKTAAPRILAGRREWLALPELGVNCLNAKLDTGARTSCLHAAEIQIDEAAGRVRFVTSDHAGRSVACEAPMVKRSRVRNSGGRARRRVFIETEACLPGGFRRRILLSLADRAVMKCPVLLGREALAGVFLVDPQGTHLLGGIRSLPGGAGP